MTRRRRYSVEFKREALRRANEESVADVLVVEQIGYSTCQLRHRRDEAKKYGDDPFSGCDKVRNARNREPEKEGRYPGRSVLTKAIRCRHDGSRSSREDDEAQSDFVFTIEEIVFPAENIAIVYGHGDSTRETEDGQPCHHNYWSSNTFMRQEDAWKPVFSHVSGVTCTPIK